MIDFKTCTAEEAMQTLIQDGSSKETAAATAMIAMAQAGRPEEDWIDLEKHLPDDE